MLYLVVHHRRHPDPPWPNNDWIDDNTVRLIETTEKVARECEAAKQAGQVVRFHRCGLDGMAPVVCSEARVASVAINEVSCWVTFEAQTALNERPKMLPKRGDNSYEA